MFSIKSDDDSIEVVTYNFYLFSKKMQKYTEVLKKEDIVSVKTYIKNYEDWAVRLNTSDKDYYIFQEFYDKKLKEIVKDTTLLSSLLEVDVTGILQSVKSRK